ncbi:MvaI/BcnI restriction endonuclease family protein [Nocardioides sp. B-3]|uniref:MvaI/BcnI restriction endonuclease family protein n=1 Tax=Nocardioides sp. B-3 TaxID=2895565 RepID=UPI0021538F52|nr:MvaI/BcnI restriction endonuclease family protein [Nocardioides sp. B-3]UUZ59594.1 MvaI/BcnI restriction endonuclease family protein [Nocardioides sp. B-3]
MSDLLSKRGVSSVAFKLLPPKQDNDKNQIYFGADLTSGGATFIPSTNLRGEITESRKPGAVGKTLFRADVDFWWITRDADAMAPNAKMIFYPQYPEARLSGLIKGCSNAPRTLYSRDLGAQVPGRVFVLGTTDKGRTYGLLLPPASPAALSLAAMASGLETFGVLHLWRVHGERAMSRDGIAAELHGVHLRGWVPGCRLTRAGIIPYFARPAGGATLEAQLGVVTNADAVPDFRGWELKQHSGSVLTLLTSEPDGGLYRAGLLRVHAPPRQAGRRHSCRLHRKTSRGRALQGWSASDAAWLQVRLRL